MCAMTCFYNLFLLVLCCVACCLSFIGYDDEKNFFRSGQKGAIVVCMDIYVPLEHLTSLPISLSRAIQMLSTSSCLVSSSHFLFFSLHVIFLFHLLFHGFFSFFSSCSTTTYSPFSSPHPLSSTFSSYPLPPPSPPHRSKNTNLHTCTHQTHSHARFISSCRMPTMVMMMTKLVSLELYPTKHLPLNSRDRPARLLSGIISCLVFPLKIILEFPDITTNCSS